VLGGKHAEREQFSSSKVLLVGMSERGSSFHPQT